jgi:protein TonB
VSNLCKATAHEHFERTARRHECDAIRAVLPVVSLAVEITMPRDMFNTESTSAMLGARKWYAMPVAVLAHTFGIGAVIAVPLLATNALPTPESVLTFVVAPPAPAPPPPPIDTPAESPQIADEPVSVEAAPLEPPSTLTKEPPPSLASVVVIRNAVAPANSGTGATGLTAPPPPAIAEPPAAPLRVGGDIKEPKRLEGPSPTYPVVARAARMEGTVLLEAVIGKDGLVKDVRILRSAAMFDEAAVAAVRQWRYTVPMLNGQPIEVVMTVNVHFGMGR